MPSLALPDDHLALVVEDALAGVDARAGRAAPDSDDLRPALLYGWAIGAVGSRELVARVATDLGLQYLLGDRRPSFAEVRAYREAHRPALEADLALALAVCRAAGLARLGRIALPQPADGRGDAAYPALARGYLDEADAVDERDDREIGANARGDELPTQLVAREGRRERFAQLAAMGPTIRPARRRLPVVRALASAVATLALLLGGLLLIRWVGAANAEVSYTGQARVPVAAAPAAATAMPTPVPASASPTSDDLAAASEEGLRLGLGELAADDLQTARDFFLLAHEAMPENAVAADRYRQVETALTIDERTGDWTAAVEDIAELRRVAPNAPTLLAAYVTALVGAGRDALTDGDAPRAFELCTEATRWLPARTDAQSCLAAARQGVSVATRPALLTPTARVVTPTPPLGPPAATATPAASSAASEPVGLLLALNGGCQAAAAGARSLQVEGTLSADGGAATGATVQVRIQDAEGRVIDNSSFPVAAQRFSVQRTIFGGGPHTVTATATLAGYEPGEATLRVIC